MECVEGALADPVMLGTVAVSALAAFTILWTIKTQQFNGKLYYALTFAGVIWTLLSVGFEAASASFACQLHWATVAWLGNALIPIAWCFFVFAYVQNPRWLGTGKTIAALALLPTLILAVAATNPWHNLVYAEGTAIPQGGDHIDYQHGLGFYLIIGTLYVFVLGALYCLARAFTRAKRSAWPLLFMLVIITLTPFATNAAYVGLGFKVFGLDPTAFMFTIGIIAFSCLLATNKTMDMASIGKSVLFNTMSEPVVLINKQRNIVLMNSAAKARELDAHASGALRELFETVEQRSHGEDIVHLELGQRFYEPRVQDIENPINPSASVLGWSVTFVDVTDRIAIHASLEEALQKAEDANRAKDEFVSVISHEMRTPLTSVKGGLTLALSGRLGDLSEPIRSSSKSRIATGFACRGWWTRSCWRRRSTLERCLWKACRSILESF